MQALVRPTQNLSGRIDPPSSKNYTTRYLLAAALAEGESIVRFPAASDDASAMRRCLRELGAEVEDVEDEKGPLARIRGFGGGPTIPALSIPTMPGRCCAC